MTRSDFLDWKQDGRTQEIMRAIEAECFDISQVLARTAGVDSLQDRFNVGVITGMEKILQIDYEETSSND